MKGSIRTRLLAGTAIGVSLTFAVSGILVYTLTRSQLGAQFDDALAARAHALSALVEQDGNTIETDLGREELAHELHELWHPSGKVLRRSSSLGTRDLTLVTTHGLSIDPVTLPDGSAGRQATFVFQPHQDTEEAPASAPVTLTLAVTRDTAELDATIARLGRVLVAVGFAATLLCVALLAGIVRFGLAPIRRLAAAIAERREGNLARLDEAGTPDDLRPVVERLNDLLRRLETAFARERELTAEVAHELRTPMAGLRATIELALDRERTPERYRTALSDCLTICTQTERMVESLLSLARLDAGMIVARSETVELDDLIRQAIEPHAARGVTIETELVPVTLATDRDQLRVVIHNLVDNAVSYATAGGSIRVEADGQVIRVSNPCTLTADEVAHVFDRFWRGDQARSAGTHAGIGLALCKKLVELLGGTITAAVKDGRFVVLVVLPRTSSIVVDSARSST